MFFSGVSSYDEKGILARVTFASHFFDQVALGPRLQRTEKPFRDKALQPRENEFDATRSSPGSGETIIMSRCPQWDGFVSDLRPSLRCQPDHGTRRQVRIAIGTCLCSGSTKAAEAALCQSSTITTRAVVIPTRG